MITIIVMIMFSKIVVINADAVIRNISRKKFLQFVPKIITSSAV